uniref:glutathione transferase n=1 Tax=Fagus sylvatica TaxID=28930 RepID=A0A2N9I595_FAGSY
MCITESRAITAYVAEKFKETGTDLIRHNNLKEAALVKVWIEVESQTFNPAISPIIIEFFVAPKLGKTPDQAIIDANLEKLGKVLDVYESKLSSTKYLAGDFFSLADLSHFPYTHYFMQSPWASVVNDRPHVKAWWEDISSRPAFKKVAEGMTFG